MKKKGFTLIELLAVIVILAIIALIITPMISNIIDSARKQAFKESVSGIIDSTNNYVSEYVLKHKDDMVYPVTFACDGESCKYGDDTLTFKGEVPKSGNIVLTNDGVLAEYITNGKYCTYGYKWNLVVEDNCGAVDVTKPTITGVQSGKNITLTMIDNASGIHGYCVTSETVSDNCIWRVPDNAASEIYAIPSVGTWYFFAKDNKGNISDGINFVTTSSDYCQYATNSVALEIGAAGTQAFTVPAGCAGTYKLEVWGAQGGGSYGGKGGYSSGNVVLSESDVLYAVVGGTSSNMGAQGGGIGGYNGGGDGRAYGGGGATHIGKTNTLLRNTTQANLYIVAGGGGGGSDGSISRSDTGAGGGASGVDGFGNGSISGSGSGKAGNQSNGGTGAASGGYGYGGSNNRNEPGTCAGGGGGFYGGGSSGNYNGCSTTGGGGSGYIGGVIDGQTIAGNQTMPTHNGASTMTGNSGNGYAKITYLGD